MSLKHFERSEKLNRVTYAIRGPIFDKAQQIEASGQKVLSLNIGNPAPFGFTVPDTMIEAMANHASKSIGYVHHLGIAPAREAVQKYMHENGVHGVKKEHIFLGNGVSELILMSMQAILNEGDEILIPSPDYPLWTAAVTVQGGRAVHYICDEASDWQPDVKDIASKITSKTKGIVLINPNNPTGAVYDKSLLDQIIQLARVHQLLLFSDEIYDKILFDGAIHYPLASLCDDVPIFTYGGISKNQRAAGWRAGWLIYSGPNQIVASLLEGLNLLASLRLCANVPAQYTIPSALKNERSIDELVAPEGRLAKQRALIYRLITDIPGISCVKPKGALYLFPKINLEQFNLDSDEAFALQLLEEEQVLIVPGSGFNHLDQQHFRIVFLPSESDLVLAADKIKNFFHRKKK